MNRIIILLLILILSCKEKKNATYNLAIPKSKLINILTDIYIAENAIKEHGSKNKDSLKNLYFTEIYSIHKVSAEEIKKELEKLTTNLPLNEIIQREVLDSLKKIQTYKYRPAIQ